MKREPSILTASQTFHPSSLATTLVASLVALTTVGCGSPEFGEGIGRPRAPVTQGANRQPLLITEIFVAGDAADRFVELTSTEGSVNLDLMSLCFREACMRLSGTVSDGSHLAFALPTGAGAFDVSPSVGAFAVVDDESVVHAYAAWGEDPTLGGDPNLAAAVFSGAGRAGDFLAVPFPFPAGVSMVFGAEGFVSEGCASPSRGVIGDGVDLEQCPSDPPVFGLTEFFSTGSETWIELQSTADDDVNLEGLQICQAPSCARVSSGVVLPANGTLQVVIASEVADIAAVGLESLTASGELVVVLPGDASFIDSERWVSYVRYGAEGSTHYTQDAVTASLWPSIDDAAPALSDSGESLGRVLASTDWVSQTPSPGVEN